MTIANIDQLNRDELQGLGLFLLMGDWYGGEDQEFNVEDLDEDRRVELEEFSKTFVKQDEYLEGTIEPEINYIYLDKVNNKYYRFEGYNDSWAGCNADWTVYEVVPQEVTVTKWNDVGKPKRR